MSESTVPAKGTIQDSVVTITGGTGSFGSTMAMNPLRKGVGTINIFSRDEANRDAIRCRIDAPRVRYFIGDVRDEDSVERAVRGADFVFDAGALKHLSGSNKVIDAAAKAGVRSVVCLRTDKAVSPVSAMGMTKALMEKTAQAFARSGPNSATTVSMTRYGNVPCRAGRPVRPQGSREHTLETLARAVAWPWGDDDPEIRAIGSRRGEKLHEMLLSREERVKAEDQGRYFRVLLEARSLQYQPYFDEGETRTAGLQDYTSKKHRPALGGGVEGLAAHDPKLAAQPERKVA